jgi:hypothetical protein
MFLRRPIVQGPKLEIHVKPKQLDRFSGHLPEQSRCMLAVSRVTLDILKASVRGLNHLRHLLTFSVGAAGLAGIIKATLAIQKRKDPPKHIV